MKEILYSEESMRRYLLGELPAPEKAALETEYFSDHELYDRVCEVESDLIQDYLSGKLSQSEHERFESHYLATPEKRQQIEFSRALTRAIAQTRRTEPARLRTSTPVSYGRARGLAGWWSSILTSFGRPGLALGFSLALAALLAIGGWLLVSTLRLRRDLSQERAAMLAPQQELEKQLAAERLRNDQLTAELERVHEQLRVTEQKQTELLSTPAIVTILLSSGLSREGTKQKTFHVPPDAGIVRIQLKLASNDYLNYQATLNSAEGKYVWSLKQVKARGGTISLRVPARLLPAGDYLLTVNGVSSSGKIEDVSSYYFRVDQR